MVYILWPGSSTCLLHLWSAETALELDFVRPQHLLLRVAGRALIMWDSIEVSESWVMDQLPPLLQVGKFQVVS